MTRLLLLLTAGLGLLFSGYAAPPKHKPRLRPKAQLARPMTAQDSAAAYQAQVDSVHATFTYQTGHITLPGSVGELDVPHGFRYLDSTQASRVLHGLWHNPPGENLGMLLPDSLGPLSDGNWAYVIHYDPSGYVKDDDADDIKYDELLDEMQKDLNESNAERTAGGYETIHLIGWGATPFYDKQAHTLHWAKLLRFGDGLTETLNYNVRILGRQGVLVFNAVAEPAQLPQIRASIPALLANVRFAQGQQYKDFTPGVDEVAAYGIGGLVAGKVLAKVGFFALIVKFWKVLILALGGGWAAVRRFFGASSKEA